MSKEVESEFFEWLKSKGLSRETLRDYKSAASRLQLEECECEFACIRRKILKVRTKPEKRVIQNYVRFCTDFTEELEESKAKKLKRLLNDRFKESPKLGVQHISISLEEVTSKVTKGQEPYALMLYFSGLRLSEVLKVKEFLDQGERPKVFASEYGYMELNWKRGHKVALFCFAPLDVFEALANARRLSYEHLKDMGLAKILRKNFYQRCIRVTKYPELCKFMQGRVSELGVSEEHYLDLFEAALEQYPKIARVLRGDIVVLEEQQRKLEELKRMIAELEKELFLFRSREGDK